jgi:hypothetical protein
MSNAGNLKNLEVSGIFLEMIRVYDIMPYA